MALTKVTDNLISGPISIANGGTGQATALAGFAAIAQGTTTNNSASSGFLGEYISNTGTGITSGGSGNYGDICNISLTAGDWDITGIVGFSGGTSPTFGGAGISITSGNSATGLTQGDTLVYCDAWTVGVNDNSAVVPAVRMSLASTTTVYLKFRAGFSATPTMYGRISARRVR